jgi:hypothetical protein
MKIEGTFVPRNFAPTPVQPVPPIQTALPVGVSTMEKVYSGDISGRSATLFTAAFNPAQGRGAYVAMESFEGEIAGRQGTFNFIHSAATTGKDRSDEFFSIVAGSGTGALADIRGSGGMRIDADGTHRIWFDIEGLVPAGS